MVHGEQRFENVDGAVVQAKHVIPHGLYFGGVAVPFLVFHEGADVFARFVFGPVLPKTEEAQIPPFAGYRVKSFNERECIDDFVARFGAGRLFPRGSADFLQFCKVGDEFV